jgi:hypothetical protein
MSVDMPFAPTAARRPVSAANRYGVDYREVGARLGGHARPIVDAHLHINGTDAARIFRDASDAFGIGVCYSQTRPDQVPEVARILGDRVRFVTIPAFGEKDKKHAFGAGYLEVIRRLHGDFGARMVKFWNAPRLRELIEGPDAAEYLAFDSPWRVKQAELAMSLGMMFKAHVADPDTWFATKYKDTAKYGTKLDAYASLERMIDRFPAAWIAAHMGGWPEDLEFLDGLLSRHANLYLDASATKWIVREMSRHPREGVVAFMSRWKGRILFGSDIVTTDEHLATAAAAGAKQHPMGDLADSPEAAFDLYASRYAALRVMWETAWEGESPIADPDLAMTDPARFGPMSAPTLRGFALLRDVLESFLWGAAETLLAKYYPR